MANLMSDNRDSDKCTIAVSLRRAQIRELDKHPLHSTLGRSAIVRLAVQSFLRLSRKDMSDKRKESKQDKNVE